MIVGLCVLSFVVVLWWITALPARPAATGQADPGARGRGLEQRETRLRSQPDRATEEDVERLLHGRLPAADVERVLGGIRQRHLPTPLAWRWADEYGVERLLLAIDAEVTERSMRRHLDDGVTPDWQAMTVLAGLVRDGGLSALAPSQPSVLDDWTVDADAPATDLDLGGFGDLPPIAGPARLSHPSSEWDPEELAPGEAHEADHDEDHVEDHDGEHDGEQRPEGPPDANGNWPLAS